MTSNVTILDQTTTDAREIDDTQLDAVYGGWRPHRVYVPRASAPSAERNATTE